MILGLTAEDFAKLFTKSCFWSRARFKPERQMPHVLKNATPIIRCDSMAQQPASDSLAFSSKPEAVEETPGVLLCCPR